MFIFRNFYRFFVAEYNGLLQSNNMLKIINQSM